MWVQTTDGGAVNLDNALFLKVTQVGSVFAIDAIVSDEWWGTSGSGGENLAFRRLKHEDFATYEDAAVAIWRMTGAVDPSNIP